MEAPVPRSLEKRTNGRSSLARTAIRASIAALARVAPPLASRIAEKLFFTPPRYPASASESAWIAGAEPFEVKAGGRRIQAWRWGRGPAVLLVHGWGGRGGQLGAFVAPLVASGKSVIAFDGPGHGRSQGRRSSLVEIADAIRAVADAAGPVESIVAHSLGAAASVLVLGAGLKVEKVVFVGAPAHPAAYFDRFMAALAFPRSVAAKTRSRLEKKFQFRWDALDVVGVAPTLGAGLLVFHDEADADVPVTEGIEIVSAWPGARLITTRGLGHRRILRDPAVIFGAVAFLTGADPRFAPNAWEPSPALKALEDDLYDRESRRERIFAAV